MCFCVTRPATGDSTVKLIPVMSQAKTEPPLVQESDPSDVVIIQNQFQPGVTVGGLEEPLTERPIDFGQSQCSLRPAFVERLKEADEAL